ncbi:two-component system, LytTR family, response regulator AgrA [Enterococcus sp. AZ194]|uniref:LytR/AlgR family response regulator transcription factor n=1 Tax=Enterococcus sp. AZ194 TaxID=2774629 RepID=UPI003F295942
MVPIYICEDDEQIRGFIEKAIESYCMIQAYDFKIAGSSALPQEIINQVREHRKRGIYFLDVDLKQAMNGFDLGVAIRKEDPRGFIVYITTHDELLQETFRHRLEVMDYIIKDDKEHIIKRIKECLDHIHAQNNDVSASEEAYFKVRVFGRVAHIPIKEILFFETSSKKHVVNVYTEKEMLEFSGNLTEVSEQLPETFVRVHRSFLANLGKMKSFDAKNNTLEFSNGAVCYVSRKMKSTVKEYC